MDRFYSKVHKTDSCWIWTASKNRGGYGQFKQGGKMRRAHVVAFEFKNGQVPDGLQLDHKCRVRSCVNPDHLEPVTKRENILRGISPAAVHAKKTHCAHGHPYSAENTYLTPNGSRECRECVRARVRKYKGKVKP